MRISAGVKEKQQKIAFDANRLTPILVLTGALSSCATRSRPLHLCPQQAAHTMARDWSIFSAVESSPASRRPGAGQCHPRRERIYQPLPAATSTRHSPARLAPRFLLSPWTSRFPPSLSHPPGPLMLVVLGTLHLRESRELYVSYRCMMKTRCSTCARQPCSPGCMTRKQHRSRRTSQESFTGPL